MATLHKSLSTVTFATRIKHYSSLSLLFIRLAGAFLKLLLCTSFPRECTCTHGVKQHFNRGWLTCKAACFQSDNFRASKIRCASDSNPRATQRLRRFSAFCAYFLSMSKDQILLFGTDRKKDRKNLPYQQTIMYVNT